MFQFQKSFVRLDYSTIVSGVDQVQVNIVGSKSEMIVEIKDTVCTLTLDLWSTRALCCVAKRILQRLESLTV